MKTTAKRPASRLTIGLNKTKTFFSKPYNVILMLMGIVFTVTTIAHIVAIIQDTLKIHPAPSMPPDRAVPVSPLQLHDLFTSRWEKPNCDAPAEHPPAAWAPAMCPFCSAALWPSRTRTTCMAQVHQFHLISPIYATVDAGRGVQNF